ncbi:MAG: DUF1345 domain-containing protein [Ferruginibacter sp.]
MAAGTGKGGLFLQLRPMQRVMLSISVSALVYLLIYNLLLDLMLTLSIVWVAFALTFIITSWIVFFKLPVEEIVIKANKEDGSRTFVMLSILLSSFASMVIVLLLIISGKHPGHEFFTLLIAVAGIVVSWVLVHTIFSFHYAHMYYFTKADDTPDTEALEFPGNTKPDYLDFAYFSFVIGMTFQVSDVEISSKLIRRTVLAHSLLSFALNTFVVALTINLIAGLKH